jgi:hypothetical protein
VQVDQQTKTFFHTCTSFVLGNGESFKFWVDPGFKGIVLVI